MIWSAMAFEHITDLAAPGESEALEFKVTTGTRREATMRLCAFLNQCGGQKREGPFRLLLRKLMTREMRVEELGLTRLFTQLDRVDQ